MTTVRAPTQSATAAQRTIYYRIEEELKSTEAALSEMLQSFSKLFVISKSNDTQPQKKDELLFLLQRMQAFIQHQEAVLANAEMQKAHILSPLAAAIHTQHPSFINLFTMADQIRDGVKAIHEEVWRDNDSMEL